MLYFPDLIAHSLWLIYAALFLSLGLTWIWGGGPERCAVGTVFLMLALQFGLLAFIGDEQYEALDLASLTADITGAVGFTLIALNADRMSHGRFWIIPMMASLQWLTVLGHGLQEWSSMAAWSYVTFKTWPTMLVVIGLMPLSSFLHRKRIKVDGIDRDWFPYKKMSRYRKIVKASNIKGF